MTKNSWKQKELHGTHANQLDSTWVDKDASSIWLKQTHIYCETAGFIMEIQDRIISGKQILKEAIEDKCRRLLMKPQNTQWEDVPIGCAM